MIRASQFRTTIIASVVLVLLTSCLPVQAKPKLAKSFRANGKIIDKIIVDGRPPKHFRAPAAFVPKTSLAAGVVTLPTVPAFDWSYGCSATAAAMMMGYYDNTGYSNMYAGPTDGGICPMNNSSWGTGECPLSATHMGKDGRLIEGHVDDYWRSYGNGDPDPYIGVRPEHTYGDCTADYMGTNQSKYNNPDGATIFYFYQDGSPLYDYAGEEPASRDGCHGIRLFAESRGYSLSADSNFSQYIRGYGSETQGFTFADYMSEIDAARPVLIQVEGHTMLGFGYEAATQTVYIHDTWDYLDHTMTWGGSYSGMQHYGVTVLRLQCGVAITGQPTDVAVCPGESATLSIAASGAPPLTYQWRKNGTNVYGATDTTYTIPAVGEPTVGTYDCIVSNPCGSVTSKPAKVSMNRLPSIWAQPQSQNATIGTTATFSIGAYGTGLTYRWQVSADRGVSFSNVTTGTGGTTASYTTPVVSPSDDTKQFRCIVSGVCPPSVTSTAASLTVVVSAALLSEGFEAPFVAGVPMGWYSQYEAGDLDWVRSAGDHNGGGAAVGTYNALLYSSNGVDRRTSLITPIIPFASCNATATLTFSYKQVPQGSQQDTLSLYYRTSTSSEWVPLANYLSSAYTWTRQTIWLDNLSTSYQIRFCATAKGGSGVCIDDVVVIQDCCPGTLDAQPTPVETCAGSNVVFSVSTTGVGLNYRWRKNGTPIQTGFTEHGSEYRGTSTRSFWILNAQPADAASAAEGYDCLIFNACSSFVSNRVSLSVSSPPFITVEPANQIVRAARPVTLSVTATGGPLSYQWSKNGQAIPGATGAAYTIPNVTLTDAGSYDCLLSSLCGTARSRTATLTVVPPSATVADARLLSDSVPTALDNKLVTYADSGFFYIQDDNRACGIRVKKSTHGLMVGDRTDVIGYLATDINNEHLVDAVTAVKSGTGEASPLGIGTSCIGGSDWSYDPESNSGQRGADGSSAGANNIGLLVRTYGRFHWIDATTFTLDDGSGVQLRCVVKNGVPINPSWQHASVTGVVSIYRLTSALFPPQVLVRDVQGF